MEARLEGRATRVCGRGGQPRRTPLAGDAVTATIAAIEGGAIGEIYNSGGGEPITLNDAIRVIGQAVGVEPVIQHGPARIGDQRHTQADTTKARLAFGFQPTVGPVAGLGAQADWQRALRIGATSARR